MRKNVVHISESEAASDFALVMTRVREGAEVIIERDAKPVAVVRPAEALRGRPISESIALAEVHAMVRTCLSVIRHFRSSTFFTFDTSKNFKTGVFRSALKSPRFMATPKIT